MRADVLQIDYQVGDAEAAIRGRMFDAVISTCGIMLPPGPRPPRELARVCRPGGRIALTTWLPDGNVFKMFQIMKRYMPPPPAPPPSPFDWGNPERIRQLLSRSFELKMERAVSYYREPSAEAAWDISSPVMARPGCWRRRSIRPRRGGLRADFVAFHAGFSTAIGICVPREYWLTVGDGTPLGGA